MKSKDREKVSMSDEELRARNASAYNITTALFVGSLLANLPFYYLLGVDEKEPWPAITSLILSVVLPVSYLAIRRYAGGPGLEEFLHYCELKDGWSRKWQIRLFAVWIAIVVSGVFAALFMNQS